MSLSPGTRPGPRDTLAPLGAGGPPSLAPASGACRERRTTFKPPEAPGLASINRALVTPDGRCWAYSYQPTLSDLFVAEKIR
jgi:hypothetical protein